jgi:hypothetical protein
MTHEEYMSRLNSFTDSPEDVSHVLLHADSCVRCRREGRFVERALSQLDPGRRSVLEEIARFGATAAVLAIILVGVNRLAARPDEPTMPVTARYRVVGNASGVVAYTPAGIVVGMAGRPGSPEKGVAR